MTASLPFTPGTAWTDGYVSAWDEAAAYCAGAASSATTDEARAVLWRAYEHCTAQADETRKTFNPTRRTEST